MKKICFVTTIYGTYRAFLQNFATYLHQTGEYEVYLICNEEERIYDDIQSFIKYLPVKIDRGIRLSALSSVKQIEKLMKEYKFDIVQYSTPNASFYTSIAAKKANIPVRLYCQWGIRYMGFEGWKRQLFKALEKTTCSKSTFVEVESHNLRNFSLEEGLYSEGKSCVVWNGSASGVDLSKFNISNKSLWRERIRSQYSIDENDLIFSYAARLTADKGLNELLQAFLSLSQSNERIRLFVMGAEDNIQSINSELLKQANESDKVFITGSVPNVEEYFAATDVFVSPSYREGFGLVVIEAESMGVPVVVSDVPGQTDALIPNETGLLCEVRNASSLKEQMEKMINDAQLREKYSANAEKFVRENFEQQMLFEHLKNHRDELIGDKNA